MALRRRDDLQTWCSPKSLLRVVSSPSIIKLFVSAKFNSWCSDVNVKGHQGVRAQISFHHLKFCAELSSAFSHKDTSDKKHQIYQFSSKLLLQIIEHDTDFYDFISHWVWEGWLNIYKKQPNKCCSWSEKCCTTEWDNFSHQCFWSQHFYQWG